MSSMFPDDPIQQSGREAWRADTASPSELRRGYARFLQRRARRRSGSRLVGFVVIGVLFGVGLAQAASTVQQRWFSARPTVQAPTRLPQSSARPAVMPTSGSSAAFTAASSTEPTVPPLASPRASAPVTPAPQLPLPVREQWQRAAAALRDRDFERARSALLEIERSAPGAEGDAARLARAQLLDSHGGHREALLLAEELAGQARSAQVRSKARELAAQWRKSSAADRSDTKGPATQ